MASVWVLYLNHKNNAKRRDIVFTFSYPEWVGWWVKHLGPDWLLKRGRGRDQYCMARKSDIGPYSVDNVDCITNGENGRLQKLNGKCPGPRTITEAEAAQIYESQLTVPQLAKKFSVSTSLVRSIKIGRSWRSVTKQLIRPKPIDSRYKLSHGERVAIYYATGDHDDIATEFGVSRQLVVHIKRGGRRKDNQPPRPATGRKQLKVAGLNSC